MGHIMCDCEERHEAEDRIAVATQHRGIWFHGLVQIQNKVFGLGTLDMGSSE